MQQEALHLFIETHQLSQVSCDSQAAVFEKQNGLITRIPLRKLRVLIFLGIHHPTLCIERSAVKIANSGVSVYLADRRGNIKIRVEPTFKTTDAIWYWLENRTYDPVIKQAYAKWLVNQISRLYGFNRQLKTRHYEGLTSFNKTLEKQLKPLLGAENLSQIKRWSRQFLDLILVDAMSHVEFNPQCAIARELRQEWQLLLLPKVFELLLLQDVDGVNLKIGKSSAQFYARLRQQLADPVYSMLMQLKYILEDAVYAC
jgi:hypothetical protein